MLGNIENERIERTVSTKDTDKFAKAVCAFANDLPRRNLPGYLMIGADDDGTLCGLKVTDELLRNLAGLRSDGNIQPKPALMVDKMSFSEGDLAIVEVQPSKATPVKYKGVTYVRIGARKSEANEEDERILREKSEIKSPTFDTTPCLHSTIDDLDLNLFKKEYLPKFVSVAALKKDKRNIKQQLASLKLFDMVHDCPTVAGILLIGKDTSRILFGAYIQYVKFAGTSRTSKILNERQFSGNILSLLKELEYFIKYTIQTQRPVSVSVLREEMLINYPYEAIRELAMNLVMHRNYQTNSPAKFYEYPDRIEMDNPGGLYGKVCPENFPNENDYRNPVIADAMKTFGYVNRFSRGINAVQEELTENQNGLALFNFKDITTFRVTVKNADEEAEKVTENEAEKVTENDIKKGTGKVTGKDTKKVTEKATEDKIQNTDIQVDNKIQITENDIEKGTEKVTGKDTRKVTGKGTEKVTEEISQNTYIQSYNKIQITENDIRKGTGKVTEGTKKVTGKGTKKIAKGTGKVTGKSTEKVTGKVAEKGTGTVTDKNTEKVTDKNTKKVTGKSTEKVTKKVTGNVAEKGKVTVTEKSTGTVTDKNSEKVTGKNIEKVTGKGTKKVTKGTRKVTENQRTILHSIFQNPNLSSNELSMIVGITPEKIRVNLTKLKTKGLLERIGGTKGGYWKIKNKTKI